MEENNKDKKKNKDGLFEVRLKPVVYTSSDYKRGAPNKIQQNLLLKAMQVTSDPKELRKMIGVRTVAEVYRTLDKLSIRKEYHEALARNGVSLDYIIKGIKGVADTAYKDADKINALKVFLKSIGMEKYEAVDSTGGGTWEETLLKALENDKKSNAKALGSGKVLEEEGDNGEYEKDYDVNPPVIPEKIKKMQEETIELTKSIYD